MARKVATIQTVREVLPVMGMNKDGEMFEADSLVLVKFEDIAWQCVARKDDGFAPGDLGVYIEISSVVPETETFEFLRPRGFRVSTARFLKTALSQGLFMPLSILPKKKKWKQGDDVSEMLGVTPYDPPLPDAEDIVGIFPPQVLKHEEIRVQSVPRVLQEMRDIEAVMTIKCDGYYAAYAKIDGELRVCSRNYEIGEADNVYWRVVKKYPQIRAIPEGFAFMGEVVGPGIRKNRMGLKDVEIRFFSVYDILLGKYLPQNLMMDYCSSLGLPVVPVIYIGKMDFSIDELLAEAAALAYPGTRNPIEGLVVRPYWEEKISPALGGRLSFKVISNRYLENGGE